MKKAVITFVDFSLAVCQSEYVFLRDYQRYYGAYFGTKKNTIRLSNLLHMDNDSTLPPQGSKNFFCGSQARCHQSARDSGDARRLQGSGADGHFFDDSEIGSLRVTAEGGGFGAGDDAMSTSSQTLSVVDASRAHSKGKNTSQWLVNPLGPEVYVSLGLFVVMIYHSSMYSREYKKQEKLSSLLMSFFSEELGTLALVQQDVNLALAIAKVTAGVHTQEAPI